MSKFSNLKLRYKIGVGVATGAVILGAAGGAFAYWTSTGAGSGTASTGSTSANDISISDNASTLNAMGPGVADQNVTVKFKNTNASFTERLASATVTLTVAGGAGSCVPGDYEINGTQYTAAVSLPVTAQEIAAGSTYTATNLYKVGFFDESGTDQSGCEGATVTLTYASA